MGKGRQRVAADGQFRRFAPRGIAALRGADSGKARIAGVGLALRQIHRAVVGRKRTDTLVEGRVQLGVNGLWLAPLALIVLLGIEDVGGFGARDAAQLLALCLVACRREVELVVVVAAEHRREVGAARVKEVFALHRVFRVLLAQFRCLTCSLHTFAGQQQVGTVRPAETVDGSLKGFLGVFVVAVLHQQLT